MKLGSDDVKTKEVAIIFGRIQKKLDSIFQNAIDQCSTNDECDPLIEMESKKTELVLV